MVQEDNKIINMKFDEAFYRKMAVQKWQQQDYKKAAEYYNKVLEMSPNDFKIQVNYAKSMNQIGLGNEVEKIFYENIIKEEHVEDSYYELSHLNVELNDPNKAFLFGINYVILTDDEDFKDYLNNMFEVSYVNKDKLEIEAKLFAIQLLFQYLFSQGRLEEAKTFILNQEEHIQEYRIIRNLLAMCYLYLGEYDIAKDMFEELLNEDKSDVHALCHYTLLLYNINDSERYKKYLKILNKVVPMNDDESFKLGIVLSYLKQYEASQKLLIPLYRKGKFTSIQMYNALSFNSYYLGNINDSKMYWNKLREISKVSVGYPPWMIEESKHIFDQKILPLILDDDSHYRIYGIFLLSQMNGKEVLMTEEIWKVLETLNEYEKLYLTYLVQGLKLTKLDFIHKGLKKLYELENISKDTELFIGWIDKAEALIADKVDYEEINRYVAAHLYLHFRYSNRKITKKEIYEWFGITRYKIDSAIEKLLSI